MPTDPGTEDAPRRGADAAARGSPPRWSCVPWMCAGYQPELQDPHAAGPRGAVSAADSTRPQPPRVVAINIEKWIQQQAARRPPTAWTRATEATAPPEASRPRCPPRAGQGTRRAIAAGRQAGAAAARGAQRAAARTQRGGRGRPRGRGLGWARRRARGGVWRVTAAGCSSAYRPAGDGATLAARLRGDGHRVLGLVGGPDARARRVPRTTGPCPLGRGATTARPADAWWGDAAR